MKKTLLLTLLSVLTLNISAQKYVGGDISLVPAFEAAGDVWLDADGNEIKKGATYSDGMITYLSNVAEWNAIRVRLLVDPTVDDNICTWNDSLATVQDIEYVKKLGKRVKDAGMSFLLDIFYSDTWTDVSRQWIPNSWGFNKNTSTETLAAKVKSYTTEVLNELVAYGAKPDFIQLGNEVSYGMLWDNLTGLSKNNCFYLYDNYNTHKTKIERFAALLNAAKEGVNASNASDAKIVLHCERTLEAAYCVKFYQWMEQAGFTSYDIIGLSYYPIWHGTLSDLNTTLTQLKTQFPNKKIHIVETGYQHTTPSKFASGEKNTSSTWPYSAAGQASFMKDLINTLKNFDNVTGFYYWQPEECGNGADPTTGVNRIMNHYDYRGFWKLSWKSGTHALESKDALMAMKTFIGKGDETPQETDVTSQFTNMDFESCEKSGSSYSSCPGWTINWDLGWGNNPWPKAVDQWHSGLCAGTLLQAWVKTANSLSAGNIIYQSKENMPAGTYTVSAIVYTNYQGIYIFANDDTKIIPVSTDWGTAYEVKVTTTLSIPGTLTIGLKLTEKPTLTSEANLYTDNFKVTYQTTSGIEAITTHTNINNNAWYTLDGRRLTKQPTAKGLYIHNGKKIIVK